MAPVILVTNDDGIHAQGLSALAHALESLGEVFVVAPDREQSAVGHALTLHRPLRVDKVGERRFAVNGTPSDCVNLGVLGLLPEPPVLVVSGINHGVEPRRRRDVLGHGVGGDGGDAAGRSVDGGLAGGGRGGGVRGGGPGRATGRRAAPRRGAAGEDAAERERAARRGERHSHDAARPSRVPREGDRGGRSARAAVLLDRRRAAGVAGGRGLRHRRGARGPRLGDAAAPGSHALRRARSHGGVGGSASTRC